MKANALAGIILYSPDPDRLAQFYQQVIGIPFELQSHGKIRDHYECLFNGVHFAILHRKESEAVNAVVPSFRVNNLSEFLQSHDIKPLHPLIDLGEGKCVTSIQDVDKNMIRLIQLSQ